MPISIRVPKPCNEDWEAMHPQGQQRFCDSCQQGVIDLTTATDAELVKLFTGDAPPKCARFDKRQLERVLGEAPARERAIPIAAFTTLFAVATGQETLAQGTIQVNDTVEVDPFTYVLGGMINAPEEILIGDTLIVEEDDPVVEPMTPVQEVPVEIELGETVQQENRICIRGRLVDLETRELLPFANIQLAGHQIGTTTDAEGRFELELPAELKGSVALDLTYVGYARRRMIVDLHPTPAVVTCSDTLSLQEHPLTGRIVDGGSAEVIKGARVEWVEQQMSCCTDASGMFGFPVEEEWMRGKATLRITSPGHQPKEIAVPNGQFPFAIPITLDASQAPEHSPGVIDLGEIEMETFGVLMGEVVFSRRPTIWERCKAFFTHL